MKITFSIVLFILVFYFIYKLIQLLINMKNDIIFPATFEDMVKIRKEIGAGLKNPTFSKQKTAIIIHCTAILLAVFILIWGLLSTTVEWYSYFIFSILLVQTLTFFNQFAVTEKGIISGGRFIAWGKIKEFEFTPIDVNDFNYYKFKSELQNSYELRIKMRLFFTKVIVVSNETREKLEYILHKNMVMPNRYSNKSMENSDL